MAGTHAAAVRARGGASAVISGVSRGGHPGVVLALDVGERRIGVACSDALGVLATPRGAILRTSDREAVDAVRHLVQSAGAAEVVVGLPLSSTGQMTAQAQRIYAFARKLRAIPDVRVVFWDEAHSSATAADLLPRKRSEAVARTHRQREAARRDLDAAAAAVILQEYLERRGEDAARPAPLDVDGRTSRREPGAAPTEPTSQNLP